MRLRNMLVAASFLGTSAAVAAQVPTTASASQQGASGQEHSTSRGSPRLGLLGLLGLGGLLGLMRRERAIHIDARRQKPRSED